MPDDHEQRVFNTLHGDPEDAPLPEVVGVRREEHIEDACERDDEYRGFRPRTSARRPTWDTFTHAASVTAMTA